MSNSESVNGMLQTLATWGAAGVGLVGSAALLRRRLSKDHVERKKDRAESGMIGLLIHERDEAFKAEHVALGLHQTDAVVIATLREKHERDQIEIVRLTLEAARFKQKIWRISPQLREFLATDFEHTEDPLA
jgi:hypothetical protein